MAIWWSYDDSLSRTGGFKCKARQNQAVLNEIPF